MSKNSFIKFCYQKCLSGWKAQLRDNIERTCDRACVRSIHSQPGHTQHAPDKRRSTINKDQHVLLHQRILDTDGILSHALRCHVVTFHALGTDEVVTTTMIQTTLMTTSRQQLIDRQQRSKMMTTKKINIIDYCESLFRNNLYSIHYTVYTLLQIILGWTTTAFVITVLYYSFGKTFTSLGVAHWPCASECMTIVWVSEIVTAMEIYFVKLTVWHYLGFVGRVPVCRYDRTDKQLSTVDNDECWTEPCVAAVYRETLGRLAGCNKRPMHITRLRSQSRTFYGSKQGVVDYVDQYNRAPLNK